MDSVYRVAIATSRVAGDDDADMPDLLDAIRASGMSGEAVEWDSNCAWGSFDLVVVRSTWDYAWRVPEFLSWVDHVSHAALLANPVEVIRWNLDKRYLLDLAKAGLPVVPTTYLMPGKRLDSPEGDIVVKPVVSAGARNTGRYRPAERADAIKHVGMLHGEGIDAMVQPYVKEIDTMGERALVFFNGKFSHAVRKGAVLQTSGIDNDRFPHPNLTRYTPSESELATAAMALRAVCGSRQLLPYARVDMVPGSEGEPVLMEIELIEPNLFMIWSEGAAEKFTTVLADFATRNSSGTTAMCDTTLGIRRLPANTSTEKYRRSSTASSNSGRMPWVVA